MEGEFDKEFYICGEETDSDLIQNLFFMPYKKVSKISHFDAEGKLPIFMRENTKNVFNDKNDKKITFLIPVIPVRVPMTFLLLKCLHRILEKMPEKRIKIIFLVLDFYEGMEKRNEEEIDIYTKTIGNQYRFSLILSETQDTYSLVDYKNIMDDLANQTRYFIQEVLNKWFNGKITPKWEYVSKNDFINKNTGTVDEECHNLINDIQEKTSLEKSNENKEKLEFLQKVFCSTLSNLRYVSMIDNIIKNKKSTEEMILFQNPFFLYPLKLYEKRYGREIFKKASVIIWFDFSEILKTLKDETRAYVYGGYMSKEYIHFPTLWPYRGEGWICSDDDFLSILNKMETTEKVKEVIERAVKNISAEIENLKKLYVKEKLEERLTKIYGERKEEDMPRIIKILSDLENKSDIKRELENRETCLNFLNWNKGSLESKDERELIALREVCPIIENYGGREPIAPKVIEAIWKLWLPELGELIKSRPKLFERVIKSEMKILPDFVGECVKDRKINEEKKDVCEVCGAKLEKDLSLSSTEKLFMLFDMSQEMLFKYYAEPIV